MAKQKKCEGFTEDKKPCPNKPTKLVRSLIGKPAAVCDRCGGSRPLIAKLK